MLEFSHHVPSSPLADNLLSKFHACAHLLSSEARGNESTWITLGTLFLAWRTLAFEDSTDHFHADDMESMSIGTDALFRLMELLDQPIPCGLLLGICSELNLKTFWSKLVGSGVLVGSDKVEPATPLPRFNEAVLLTLMTYRSRVPWLAQQLCAPGTEDFDYRRTTYEIVSSLYSRIVPEPHLMTPVPPCDPARLPSMLASLESSDLPIYFSIWQ